MYRAQYELAEANQSATGRASAQRNAGDLYVEVRDYDRARPALETALSIYREIRSPGGVAGVLGSLAILELELGEMTSAKKHADEALTLSRELGIEHAMLRPLSILTIVALQENRVQDASSMVKEARRILERPAVRKLGIEEASGVRGTLSYWSRIAQSLAALQVRQATGDKDRVAELLAQSYAEAGLWKGRALLEGIVERRSGGRTRGSNDLRRARREAIAGRDSLLRRVSWAISRNRPSEEIEALRAEARAFEDRAVTIQTQLETLFPRDTKLRRPRGTDPDVVRRTLGSGRLLIDYCEGLTRLFAYVIGGDGVELVDLGDRRAIGSEASSLVEEIARPDSAIKPKQFAARSHALFDTLLAPALAKMDRPIEEVIVVPGAGLASLPFEALVTEVSNDPTTFLDIKYVIDRYRVSYAPSASVLVELAQQGERRNPGKALAMADPVYALEKSKTTRISAKNECQHEVCGVEHERDTSVCLADCYRSPRHGCDVQRRSDGSHHRESAPTLRCHCRDRLRGHLEEPKSMDLGIVRGVPRIGAIDHYGLPPATLCGLPAGPSLGCDAIRECPKCIASQEGLPEKQCLACPP